MHAGLWLVTLVAWMVWGLGYPAVLVSAVNVSLNLYYRRRVRSVVTLSKAQPATWGCSLACWLGWKLSTLRRPGLLSSGRLSSRRGGHLHAGLPD